MSFKALIDKKFDLCDFCFHQILNEILTKRSRFSVINLDSVETLTLWFEFHIGHF